MGVVSDHLRDCPIEQVADHGVVVWYDPESRHTTVAEDMTISNAVVQYESNFYVCPHPVARHC